MKLGTIIAVLTTCFVLGIAGTALAQATPTQDAYGGVAGAQEGAAAAGGGEAAPVSRNVGGGGNLPFTGSDLILIGIAGSALVGTGLVLRRTTRHSS